MSACGGSFVNSPSCADNPKNKSLLQKIICKGQANPVDSITFALLTSATVPAVIAQTAKWIRCGKPSKGAPYAYGALALWGLEVARSLNNIHNDEKNLGGKEEPILGEYETKVRNVLSMSGCYVSVNGSEIYSYIDNDKTYTLPAFTQEEQNLINAAQNSEEIYNVLKPMLLRIGLNSTFEDGSLTLTVAKTGENICSDGGDE